MEIKEFLKNTLTDAKDINKIGATIRETFLNEYSDLIESWLPEDCNIESKDAHIIICSSLFSLSWGSLSLSLNETNYGDTYHKLRTCLYTLSITLANNILAIIRLSTTGLDYQASVMLRNTYELCFMLLVILADKEKMELYFDTAKNENELNIWFKHFRLKSLNTRISEIERIALKHDDSHGLSQYIKFISKWRRDSYKYYSGFTHNNFADCVAFLYNRPQTDSNEEIARLNLWGFEITRIDNLLGNLNDLLFWVGLFFYNIIVGQKYIIKEQLVSPSNTDFWDESALLYFMGKYLHEKDKTIVMDKD